MTGATAKDIAVWVITPNGTTLAGHMRRTLTEADIYISNRIDRPRFRHIPFEKLGMELEKKFNQYRGHIFIMSTGIVVRMIAPLIRHKTQDPAVVVVGAVGEVEPDHVEPGGDHLRDRLGIRAGRADRGDDFYAFHLGVPPEAPAGAGGFTRPRRPPPGRGRRSWPRRGCRRRLQSSPPRRRRNPT